MMVKDTVRENYILRHKDRHNACPICGGEAMMTFHPDDLCRAICPSCHKLEIEFGFAADYADTVEDVCRRPFNMLVLNESFTPKVLSTMGVKHEDYIVLDNADGFICFCGNEVEVGEYLADALVNNSMSDYLIYQLVYDTFYFACTSIMIEAAFRRHSHN